MAVWPLRTPSSEGPEPSDTSDGAEATDDLGGTETAEPNRRLDLIRPTKALVVRLISRLRGRHLLAIDFVGVCLAGYVALSMGFDHTLGLDKLSQVILVPALVVLVRLVSNGKLGLYSRGWRFASVPDLTRIALAGIVGTLIAFGIVRVGSATTTMAWDAAMPRSFWIVELMLSVAVIGGVRFAIRAASEWAPEPGPVGLQQRRPTLFYGAGRTGVLMARSAMRKPDAGVAPVGFLDDDPALIGGSVEGLRVYGGLSALDRAVAETGAQVLLITMPSAPGNVLRRVVDAAMAHGLDVRTVPSMNDLLDGTLDAYRVRRVQVEDLLRRPTATEHAAAVRDLIRDRTIVITGAGGSIGSELARQVFSLGPRRLVLVDRAESALYLVQRELETRRTRGQGKGEIWAHLANVASRPAMDRLIANEAPDVIFHAAAYKHVPMMEDHPSDAVHVNMGGTMALLDAAVAADVARFVLVSTDKAVLPSSVMGASKRIAEMLVADAARRTGRPYVSVRFGNVLGSNGSVVPIFQEQLERGEPLSITHPDMTRFFMTIPEASWLIMDAAALGVSGDLFVLDMGEPVKIMDLARDLVRLAGRDPDTQPMDIVGLRPGEKLHEELFYDAEQVQPTEVAKILRAMAEPPPESVRDDVRTLLAMATGGSEDYLRIALMEYARGSGVPRSLDETVGASGESVVASEDGKADVETSAIRPSARDRDRDRDREATLAL